MNVKKLIVFLVTLLVIIGIASNVYADELADGMTYLKSKIDDVVELDIREDEYKQVSKIISNQIKDRLETDGKTCSYIENEDEKYLKVENFPNESYETKIIIGCGLSASIDDINNAIAYITIYNKNDISDSVSDPKNITVNYKIHKNYSVADKNAIEALDLNPNKRYIMSFEDAIANTQNFGDDIIVKYYLQDINDETVTVELLDFGGLGGTTSFSLSTKLAIFKNGILYNLLTLENQAFIATTTVTKTLATDKNLNDYLTQKLKPALDVLKEFHGDLTLDIKKGVTEESEGGDIFKALPNVYTIAFKNSKSEVKFYEFILINVEGEEKADIQVTDNVTNVILDTTTEIVPKNTKLVISKLEKGNKFKNVEESLIEGTEKFIVYDITLESEGVSIQPDGKVKISIPIPDEFGTENVVVYRVEEDGTKTKYDVKIEIIGGKAYAVFETDHFSIYTLAVEKEETVETNNPKTGDEIFFTFVIMVISIIGIVTTIKMKKH